MVLATALVGVGSTLAAAVADAHASIVTSTPSDGGHVENSAQVITVELTEPVRILEGSVSVLDRSGTRRAVDETRLGDGGRHLRIRTAEPLADDAYLVTARVVSADTHVVSLSVRFSVGSVTTLGALPSVSSGEVGTGPAALVKIVLYLGVIASAGLVFATRWVWPGLWGADRWIRLYRLGCGLVAAGLLGRVVVLAAQAVGDWSELSADAIGAVLSAPSGLAMAAAAVAAAVSGVWTPRSRHGVEIAYLASVTAVIAITLGGHGGSGRSWPWTFLDTAVHVYAMSVWIGGVAILALVRPPEPRIGRWHGVAIAHVALVAASGAILAALQVDPPAALVTTGYGRLLMAKVAVVLLVAGLGLAAYRSGGRRPWQSFDEWPPDRQAQVGTVSGNGSGATAVAFAPVPVAPAGSAGGAVRRRLILAELGLVAVVVGLTSLLSGATPARDSYTTDVHTRMEFGAAQAIDVELDTIRRGDANLTVRYRPGDGRESPAGMAAAGIPDVRIDLGSEDANVARLPVDLVQMRHGDVITWRSEELIVPAAGRWKVTVRFDRGQGPRVGSFFVDIR